MIMMFPNPTCPSCPNFTPENEDFPAKCTLNPDTAVSDCPMRDWLVANAAKSDIDGCIYPEIEDIPF